MLSDVTVFLIVVLIGYAIVSHLNSYRPRFESLSNYAVLFESAIIGGLIFFVVLLTISVIEDYMAECSCSSVYIEANRKFLALLSFPYAGTLILSGFIGLVIIVVGNIRRSADEVRVEIARKSGLIPQLILDAVDDKCLVQITTISRKVYVGWIWMGPSITKRGQINDVAITPVRSGYRDRVTMEVHLETNYRDALRYYLYEPAMSHQVSNDQLEARRSEMSVVIPMKEITSIRRYIEELEERVLAEQQPRTSS